MNYFEVYRDCWNFHKEHSKVLNSDEYWESVIDKSREIYKKYDNSKFVRDILIAIISELERIGEEEKKNE